MTHLIIHKWRCDQCGKITKDRHKAEGWHQLHLCGYCFPDGKKEPREWGYKEKPKDFCSKECMTKWLERSNIIKIGGEDEQVDDKVPSVRAKHPGGQDTST